VHRSARIFGRNLNAWSFAPSPLIRHDTGRRGCAHFRRGARNGVETISGVEISAEYPRGTMHIVGLFVIRRARHSLFLKKLPTAANPQSADRPASERTGMNISMAEVEEEAGCLDSGPDGYRATTMSVGRPHIAS